MDGTKSVAIERVWAVILKDLGIRAENVMRRAGLPRDLLQLENERLGIGEYFRLWTAIEAEAADPLLPLNLGKAIRPEAFHPPIFAALCSADLSVAMPRIAEYKRLVAPMTVVIEEEGERFFVGFRWNDPEVLPPASLSLAELVFLVQLVRIATREEILPLEVESRDPVRPVAPYEDFFGVAPRQGDRMGVTFRTVDAKRPFLTANESMWEVFKPELRRQLNRMDAELSLSERVRNLLLESLPSGESSIDMIAQRLGQSTRTLQRGLKQEETSFKELVNRTRESLARHYLTSTKLNHAEIAYLIGYEEISSFFRAFRSWTGTTPEAVRKAGDE